MMTAADQVVISLRDEPEKWSIKDNYTINHENGIRVWIANGFFFLRIYQPTQKSFTLFEKVRVWIALRRWNKQPLIISP